MVVLALLAGVATAQAPTVPTVPTDHYGPPACTANAHPADPKAMEQAHEEQRTGAADPHALPSNEPMENFGLVREKLAAYGDCTGTNGCYWAELDAQYKRAEEKLAAMVAVKKPGEKLALVMDIDETTLSAYCEMKREDFGYVDAMFNAWVVSPEAAVAIPGALRLFNEARTAGVSVFFITGRPGIP